MSKTGEENSEDFYVNRESKISVFLKNVTSSAARFNMLASLRCAHVLCL
jgi:hypothetical protein